MTPPTPAWHTRLVRLGRLRTMLLLTGFSVGASVILVAVFFVVFNGQPDDLPAYFIPALIVPMLVAPPVIHLLLALAVALEAAHTEAARQQRELQRIQQLDLVGRLASGLAHDFNNLLTVVRANVEALGGATSNQELAAIDDAADRGARLTRRLLSISRHDDVVVAPHPLPPLLRETKEVLRRVLPTGVQFELPALIPDAVLDLDRDAIQQALLNLVLNAREAMGEQGHLTLSVFTRQSPDGPWLVLDVRDDGPGMPPDLLARATEPFFTTKAAHEGTGLGLAIVRRTMEQHGGKLVLESEVGVGTSAALWFPLRRPVTTSVPREVSIATPDEAAAGSAAATLPSPASSVPSRTDRTAYRLLVVDDEPQVRAVTERTLQRLGHHVRSVADITSAKALIDAGEDVDVIISDVMMPGGTGMELVQQLRQAGHPTPVLLVSGFAPEAVDEALRAHPSVAFLAKPWTLDGLVSGIDRLARSISIGA